MGGELSGDSSPFPVRPWGVPDLRHPAIPLPPATSIRLRLRTQDPSSFNLFAPIRKKLEKERSVAAFSESLWKCRGSLATHSKAWRCVGTHPKPRPVSEYENRSRRKAPVGTASLETRARDPDDQRASDGIRPADLRSRGRARACTRMYPDAERDGEYGKL